MLTLCKGDYKGSMYWHINGQPNIVLMWHMQTNTNELVVNDLKSVLEKFAFSKLN